MAQYISVKTEMKDVQDMFGRLVKEKENTQKAILRNIGAVSRNKVKKAYKQQLNMRSGALYRSIKYKVSKRGTSLVINAPARSDETNAGRAIYYGTMLAKGFTLTPTHAKVLRFQIEDKWISKHSITVQPHDFVEGPVRAWVGTPDYKRQIDKTLQKELDKLEKKGYTIR